MEKRTTAYTVRRLAALAGISVRTLHHYDHIGLLTPSARTPAGYRLYAAADLLRLQQILLYRELDLPLDAIRRILDDPGFDPVRALGEHRRTLEQQAARLARLLHTIDRTIARLTEVDMSLTDEELYEGLPKEQVERWKREVNERYDPKTVAESNRRVHAMSKERWNAVKAEGDAVSRRMAELMERPASDPEVQATIARQHAWIENFYPCSAEMFAGLGRHYAEHPEFRATYDRYRPGLADFMRDAMAYYAEHTLTAK